MQHDAPASPPPTGHGAERAEEVRSAPVSRAVYGLITVLAMLQILEAHPPSAWHATVTLFGTTLAVALVDAYSDWIAEMLAEQRKLTRDDIGRILGDVAPVMIGAQTPTVLLLLAALGILEIDTAIQLAQAAAFLLLFGYGWRIGQLLHERRSRQLISGLILVAIGALIVGIKSAFH